MRPALLLLAACSLSSVAWAKEELPATAEAERPNVLFFLVDDLGWADLACYGSTFHETPHLDQLAKDGIRFTDAYTAASICSPTRASIMSGKHPVRVDITDWIPGRGSGNNKLRTPEDTHHLKLEEVTIAEALKEGGYQTFYTGKWHLGGRGFEPSRQGFDVYYDPHKESSKGSPGKGKTTGRKHGTIDLTRETRKFVTENKDAPFFAMVAYYDIHTPIIAEEKHLAHYRDKAARLGPSPAPITEHDGKSRPRQDNPALATMVQAVDDSVGELVSHLEELGIADNTVVIFFSDNGGLATLRRPGPGCNLPLRASKGWLYEGGIRVPLIIRMPGKSRAGTVTPHLVNSTDFYPTLLSLAGLPKRPEQHADGKDFSSVLKGVGNGDPPRTTLYWHYPHYHGSTWTPGAAIRDGHWKLVEFYHHGGHELYNLAEDLGESRDLARSNPERAAGLLEQLHAWQKQLGAKMPVPK